MPDDRGATERIRVGPAGWSYQDWAGQVYPKPRPRGFNALAYVAQFFDTVEINSTFYRIPGPATTRNWASHAAGNSHFMFTAKLWQGFTHARTATDRDQVAFRQAMAPLHEVGRLGAVLLQFPYRFHYTADNRAYVRQLAEAFADYPLVLEIRHKSWDRPEVFAWLQEVEIGFCNIDQPDMSSNIALTRRVTSPIGYLRIHGRNAAAWFAPEADAAARYDYRYPAGELAEIVAAVEVISRQAREVYLIANNHFRGQSAVNALELRSQLLHAPIPIPPPLLAAYPELEQIAAPASEGHR